MTKKWQVSILAAQRTREYFVLVYGLPSVESDFDICRLRKYILTANSRRNNYVRL